MSFDNGLLKKNIEDLTDKELNQCYYKVLSQSRGMSRGENISVYTTELQRRENEKAYTRLLNVLNLQKEENDKSNISMRKWTIAIGIMTFIMLLATITNVIIVLGGNG